MEPRLIFLVVMILVIGLCYYVVLPRLKLGHLSATVIRSILFFGMMAYLAYDFYLKERYSYMLFLLMGSIAFVAMLLMYRKRP